MHEKTLSDLLQPDSKYVSYMKDDILMIKRLFHFHGNEEDMKQLQCQYEKYVIESSNSPHFFARLLDLFVYFRSSFKGFALSLLDITKSIFLNNRAKKLQIDDHEEALQMIDQLMRILCYISKPTIDLENEDAAELFPLLMKDDLEGFISFLARNQNFEISSLQNVESFPDISQAPIENRYYLCEPIELCCYWGSVNCFKYLMLNGRIRADASPLLAIAGGNKEIIHLLQESGISFGKHLPISIKYHRYEIMEWIFENYKPDPIDPCICIEWLNLEAFLYFLKNGFESSSMGRNHLNEACSYGMMHLVEYLIEIEGVSADEIDCCGQSPLYIACKEGFLPLVQYLIDKGAKPNKKTERGFPIHCAAATGSLSLVRYLIEKADANKSLKSYDGETLLHFACESDNPQLIQYLINQDFDIEANDNRKRRPLHTACLCGNLKVVKFLMEEAGANKDARDYEECTFLHLAAMNNDVSVTKYLVENGADIHVRDKNGLTPLHKAAYYDCVETAKYLISLGADKKAKCKSGHTPADYGYYSDAIQELFAE